MTTWHDTGRAAVNAFAGLFGVRVISADWGPRGVFDTLRRAKTRGFAPALIFDIGASNGQWTRECLSTFSGSRYVLVDPLERNRDALMAMASANDRITAWCGAAGAAPGRIEIFDHGDQSSILPSAEYPGPTRTVDVSTVDLLFEAQGSSAPVLFKADVQGYELEVLRGASRCLQSAEMLILEVSFRKIYKDSALAHEIISYVGDRGFRIYDVCSYLQRPADRDLVQSDIVFVHESSPLFSYQGWGKSS
jgi:FkbM family methyltransferase